MLKMPHWPKPLGSKPIDLDLSRINQLLRNLGNPHHRLPPVLHISGTNGKGSTLAFIQAIMESAGYKVHKYTSPHLVEFNERIVVAGKNISDGYLHSTLEECRIACGNIPITFFEGTTAAAFLAFSKIEADIILLETGLGGRLDATNVLGKPILTAITPISLDHTEYLGPTLTSIAREKAGIMKNSVPCVIGYQLEESLQELENTAADVGVPLFRYGHEWQVERLPEGFAYKENNAVLKLPNPSLLGLHQYLNAGLAVACVQCLDDFDISDEHIRKGITNTIWKGRLEQIINSELIDALPDGYELWVDGAHNVAAFEMLERSIAHWQDKDLFLIMGVTKGRNIQELLKPLAGRIKHVCGVRVESEPSACSAAEIANSVAEMGISSSATDNLLDAVNEIAKISKNPANILICGSLYLSSDIHSYQVKAA